MNSLDSIKLEIIETENHCLKQWNEQLVTSQETAFQMVEKQIHFNTGCFLLNAAIIIGILIHIATKKS